MIYSLSFSLISIVAIANAILNPAENASMFALRESWNLGSNVNFQASDPCQWGISGYSIRCQLDSVFEIHLAGSGLSGFIDPAIGKLQNLQTLVLWQNNISQTIPSELGSCAQLSTLFLAANNISGQIPAEVQSLTLSSCNLLNNPFLSCNFTSCCGSVVIPPASPLSLDVVGIILMIVCVVLLAVLAVIGGLYWSYRKSQQSQAQRLLAENS